MLRKIIFSFVLLLPALCLSVLFLSLIIHYFTLKKIDPKKIYAQLDHYYEQSYWPREHITQGMSLISEKTIVALGESSLLLPGNCNGPLSPETFTSLMNKAGMNVVNLGYCGDDSRGVIDSLTLILKEKKPRAFLFYLGHNDYSNASKDVVLKPTRFFSSAFFAYIPFVDSDTRFRINYFFTNAVEAALIEMYRAIDSSLFNTNDYRKYSETIGAHLIKNYQAIIALCRSHHVPMIFITPIGNLSYPPVAADREVKELYEQGIKKRDLLLLKQTNENDFFGHDQRAKKAARDFLLSQLANDLIVIDIDQTLIEEKNPDLYQKYFSDIFHLTKEGHEFIFHEIQKSYKI